MVVGVHDLQEAPKRPDGSLWLAHSHETELLQQKDDLSL